MQPTLLDTSPRFDGDVYSEAHDQARLTGQLQRIYAVMRDGRWRTLKEIEAETDVLTSSCSAQLRNLRKVKFGAYQVEKRRRGADAAGLWEYRVVREEKS